MSGVLGGLIAAFPTPVTSSFESIATVTATSTTGVLSFTSIPQTYSSLHIRMNGNLATDKVRIRVNNDSSSIYAWHYIRGSGSAVSASAGSSSQHMYLSNVGGATDYRTVSLIDFHDYASTTKNKTMRALTGWSEPGGGFVTVESGLYASTNAVTSLYFYPENYNFNTGSTIALYGVK